MTREELDTLWQKALHETVVAGEEFVRYRFAEMVAAAEREACLKMLDDNWFKTQSDCAAAIRARGQV